MRARRDRDHRRDLRAHHATTAPSTSRSATLPGHGGPHGHDQRALEDVLGHRLARRLGDRAAGADGGDPPGARLPDGGRGRAAAGGGHHGARAAATPTTRSMRAEYAERRDAMLRILEEAGFEAQPPAGAYYVMADCSHLGLGDDVATARHLVEHVGVADGAGLVVLLATRATARTCCGSRSARSSRRSRRPGNGCSGWGGTERPGGSCAWFDEMAGRDHRGIACREIPGWRAAGLRTVPSVGEGHTGAAAAGDSSPAVMGDGLNPLTMR